MRGYGLREPLKVELEKLIEQAKKNREEANAEFQETDCSDAMRERDGWDLCIQFLESYR